MRGTRDIMGMPIVIEVVGGRASHQDLDDAFEYFAYVDSTFSTYKADSEISRINRGEIGLTEQSDDMREIFAKSHETTERTDGYFDIKRPDGSIDPSGIVKGWAIEKAAVLLAKRGFDGVYVEAGGDIQTSGYNPEGGAWSIGIRNPFDADQIVKVVYPGECGVATSGTYMRGRHIYDPHSGQAVETPVAGLTVIGPNIYEADRFATAAFAMGERGIMFIERLSGFEGYQITNDGRATMTSGFEYFTHI